MIQHIVLVLFTLCLVRIGLRDANNYKKSKTHQRKENKKRPILKKLLGLYDLSSSNAPHHMRKYTAIRISNILSLLVGVLFYILQVPKLLCIVFSSLHFVCLVLPITYDAFILSSFQYGDDKTLHFDKSNKP